MELSERKRLILRAIVDDYIHTAEPVGSSYILNKYNLETKCEIPAKRIIELCKNDKKALKDSINIVVVDKIGKGEIKNMSFDTLGEIYGWY